jgi:cell wall-associated NlpC family hydrolase
MTLAGANDYLRSKLAMVIAVSLLASMAGCASSPERYEIGQVDGSDIVRLAEAQIGRPYRYGGTTPTRGFDCSGLVYYVHSEFGASVPRTAGEQYRYTTPLKKHELRPGDLVFFRSGRAIVSHVGIYLGENRFIHAPGSGRNVSVERLDTPYWQDHYIRGGRFAKSI